jgi:mannose-6-phosphate isomerase-like protein (cupin superfamily)
VRHRTISDIWFTLAGHGTLWRGDGEGRESLTELHYGVEVEITPLTAFQFRSTGDVDLEVLLLSMPAWPGPAEVERVERGCWASLTRDDKMPLSIAVKSVLTASFAWLNA